MIAKCNNYNLLYKFGSFAASFGNEINRFLSLFDNFEHLFAYLGILGRVGSVLPIMH